MLMVETEEKIADLKQGEQSVMAYVAELQRLWTDLDHYDPLGLTDANSIAKVRKWIERRRVIKFLKGLNSLFEGRRATMFHQTLLPTLEETIAAIVQEETRQKVMLSSPTQQVTRPAFVVTETRDCFNCGEKGHLSCNCTNPHRFSRGRSGQRRGS